MNGNSLFRAATVALVVCSISSLASSEPAMQAGGDHDRIANIAPRADFVHLPEASDYPDAVASDAKRGAPDGATMSVDPDLVSSLAPRFETKDIKSSGGGPAGQTTSLPSGPSAITGLGESFGAQLSTGIATYQIPIQLPVARGGVQPRLDLSYTSAGGYSVVGHGWALGTSAISRETDRGLPGYDDRDTWHPNQDRFVFGGMELVPICTVQSGACSGALEDEVMPPWANGWHFSSSSHQGRIAAARRLLFDQP